MNAPPVPPADGERILHLPVCEPLSLEERRIQIAFRDAIGFGVGVFVAPSVETITSAPGLEVWRHRDPEA